LTCSIAGAHEAQGLGGSGKYDGTKGVGFDERVHAAGCGTGDSCVDFKRDPLVVASWSKVVLARAFDSTAVGVKDTGMGMASATMRALSLLVQKWRIAKRTRGNSDARAARDKPISAWPDRSRHRRHEIPPLVCEPGLLQRHGDRRLALGGANRQSGQLAVQD